MLGELVRQRLYAIACGYPDGNDTSRLGCDPMQKLLGGRDPVGGEDPASQPTLPRFENAVRRADLYRMGIALADTVIERHRRRLKRKVKRITIDLDPTDDPTHGAQQLTFFNGHYDTRCYLPVAGFLSFNACAADRTRIGREALCPWVLEISPASERKCNTQACEPKPTSESPASHIEAFPVSALLSASNQF